MSDLFKKAISLGWGLTIVSKEKVEKAVEDLVNRGELAPSESKALVDRLIERGAEEQGQFKTAIREQVSRILQELDVPTENDVASLEQRVASLEKQVAELEKEKAALTGSSDAEEGNRLD
ncbi:polyhydroxyalkanoate synthesis regulator [Paenibacillus sp. 28ISP30-2]|jgi:polyhydroxyalkanoate synthesis regulator phasin|uniref:ATP synthase subunit B n=1 Tax=Paenibacillus terrae TaxID=159743 RepID=A0A0D7X9B5_9BACL|nr:phasin family protein [Paenibacillus terrae]KJD47618.1 ATP synthase subunit B [Paenibacillus terrae]MBE0340629.1 polyhydroxyalkanoate synthesis regulator [Paenibacillus sp. 28ISP30-2]